MKNRKYIMSEGLAFAEEKDMEKLRKYSQQGWHVTDFKFMGYSLEKGEKKDYIYNIDYRSLKEDEKDEYFSFFSAAGWSHVASENDFHLFRALPGTKPIYTDHDTIVEKYQYLVHTMKSYGIPVLIFTSLLWLGTIETTGTLNSIFSVLTLIFSVFALVIICTVFASLYQKWKAEKRTKLVQVMKMVLSLILIGFIILLFLDIRSFHFLPYIIMGMFALPAVIWGLMMFYQKFQSKYD